MAKPKSQLKDRVASFRINKGVDAEIEQRIKGKIAGCGCANKFYRKLALDWYNNKIVYTNPEDFKTDPDVAAAMQAASPAQSPVPKG
jgi:hypothetical protein